MAQANWHDAGIYARAEADPEGFWPEQARRLQWFRNWDRVLDWDPPAAQWFVGGQLNAAVNCVDRHALGPRADKPKGMLHTTGGYLVGTAATHHYVFDLKDDDVYWCTADIGWVTGHSYIVYGPLANGATCVPYEGTPDFPDKDRLWSIVARHRVSVLYTAPTLIRTCMKWGSEYPARHDLRSLRVLGTVGEPINPEAWIWYRQVIGGDRCPVVDTWWMTETGMTMITPLPGITTLKPGSATFPFPGVQADVVDDQGQSVPLGKGGYLVLARPWPAMARTKIMLRDIADGKVLGDTTTLSDPAVVAAIRQQYEQAEE